MGQADWDEPRTEEGLQRVLTRLEEYRAAGDLVETGNGLLHLAFLVKWVRSDTEKPPFERSHQLALQALASFRSADDERGQIRSLLAAVPMSDPRTREALLSEAEALAEGQMNENYIAMVLDARARSLAMSDRSRATDLHKCVLAIYRRMENQKGIARCLFSLSIGEGTSEEKRDYAIEAARIHRALGDPSDASRCFMVAMMNAEAIEPLVNLEDLAREGLQDALNAGNRNSEKHFYNKLALILSAKGRLEEAEKYRRWATDLQESDGLTPLERWKNDVEMTKTMIAMLRAQGHKHAAKQFQNELKRLKESKPPDALALTSIAHPLTGEAPRPG